MSGRYEYLSAGGVRFAGMWELLNAAERERRGRDGSVAVLGWRAVGSSLGYEPLGRLVRKGGVVEFEDLEPMESEEGGGDGDGR